MDCRPIMAGLGPYYAATALVDAAGKATMISAQATTGAYFLFATVRTPNGSLIWDVPMNLAAGDNAIVLNRSNAELVR
jgi:hypothetical protein